MTVESFRVMLERNTKVMNAAPTNSLVGPLFLLILGALFAGYGWYWDRGAKSFTFLLGLAFLVYGGVALIRNRRTFSWRQDRAK